VIEGGRKGGRKGTRKGEGVMGEYLCVPYYLHAGAEKR